MIPEYNDVEYVMCDVFLCLSVCMGKERAFGNYQVLVFFTSIMYGIVARNINFDGYHKTRQTFMM